MITPHVSLNPFKGLRRSGALGALSVTGALLLAACSSTDTTADTTLTLSDIETTDSTTAQMVSSDYIALTDLTEFTYEDLGVADFDVETSGAREVTLADGATDAPSGVTVEGDTITITEGGVYKLTGTLTAGQVIVDAGEDDVTVILDGVDITSSDVGALIIENADDVQVYLAAGSTNTLASAAGSTVADEEDAINATLFSTADLWIGGTGSLTVDGTAEDGITSKDTLVIAGGTLDVTATDDGIRGKDHLVIEDGDITVNAGGDGLRADNEDGGYDAALAVGVVWISGGEVNVTAGDDGIVGYRQVTVLDGDVTVNAADDGVHTEGVMRIDGGVVDVQQSYEGLEAAVMLLSGGDISVVSSDDGINVAGGPGVTSSGGEMGMGGTGGMGGQGGGMGDRPAGPGGGPGSTDTSTTTTTTASGTTTAGGMGGMESGADSGRYLEISGGTLVVSAEGDGLDSNGSLIMTGGTVVVSGPTGNGNGALDVDGEFTVSGGTLIAAGSAGMAMSPTSDGQGVLAVQFNGSIAAGTVITVTDSDGNAIVTYAAPKTIQSLVVTTTDIASGSSYTVLEGGSVSGGTAVGPATLGGTVSSAETMGSLTAS